MGAAVSCSCCFFYCYFYCRFYYSGVFYVLIFVVLILSSSNVLLRISGLVVGAINNQRYACHENQNPIKLPSRNDSDSLKNRHHSVTGSFLNCPYW